MSQNVEELVNAYMNVRNERDRVTSAFEKEDHALQDVLDKLEASLLEICNNLRVDSLKTEYGTVIRQLKERYYTQDWDGFYKFILENEVPQLLEKRIAQSNMKHYMDGTQGAGLPPGVNVFREFNISIRKPRS